MHVPRPAPEGAAACHSASRPLTHFGTFPAEIVVLPESLRAKGCGPPTAAGGRAVSGSWGGGGRISWLPAPGPALSLCSANLRASRGPVVEGWGEKAVRRNQVEKIRSGALGRKPAGSTVVQRRFLGPALGWGVGSGAHPQSPVPTPTPTPLSP